VELPSIKHCRSEDERGRKNCVVFLRNRNRFNSRVPIPVNYVLIYLAANVEVSSYLVPLADAPPVLNRRSHSADRECFYIVVLLSGFFYNV
jgi:hypothetical protein